MAFDLEPVALAPRAVGCHDPLGDDPLHAQPAGVAVNLRSVADQVLGKADQVVRGQWRQQQLELALAFQQRQGAQILAVKVQQIEGVRTQGGRPPGRLASP